MTFRWFGPTDPIPLAHIRQIPGVKGVVSALYDVAVGERWPKDRLERLRDEIAHAGLELAVVESIPVHEDIKLGRPTRDRLIANYCESVQTMGELGVQVLCYNFMPVFDWMRTDLEMRLPDGSTALAYDDAALARVDIGRGTGDLPGWAATYDAAELRALREAYRGVHAERLWDHLGYFLERVVPVAEQAGVRMAIHPDDPLSARCATHWSQTRSRDDWSVRTETWSTMHADAKHFHLTGRIEAYEGDALVFARDFAESVPRDHV